MSCFVPINNSEEKIGFILFNHLNTRKNHNFTTKDIIKEFEKKYNIKNKDREIQDEIDEFVELGFVGTRVGYYCYGVNEKGLYAPILTDIY